jgi:RasGEF N-terminal motif
MELVLPTAESPKTRTRGESAPVPHKLQPRLPLVKVGTLDSLLSWLTLNRFTGFRFLDTFLLTYKSFGLTPLTLLTRLIDTYSSPASLTVEGLPEDLQYLVLSKSQNVLKMRVLAVVLRWLQSNPYDFLNQDADSRDLVEQLLEFVEGDPSSDFRKEAEKIRRVLVFSLVG